MNLTEIYNAKRDIKESEIPSEWKQSFKKFMNGQTHTADYNEDGTVKEFVYYQSDFARWYRMNSKVILRDDKITQIIS